MKETAYLLQATLVSAWWVGLAWSDAFFAAFQFEGISPTAFWSLLAPDVILIALLSAVRAYRAANWLGYIIFGAFAYAALYCCNASVLTGTGFLSTGLMLAGLAYNALLCFDKVLFRESKSASLLLNGTKTLIQIVCVWVLTLVVAPWVIHSAFDSGSLPSGSPFLVGCMVVFATFSLLGLTSAFFMVRDGCGTPLPLDQTNRLVVSGPYRFVRNPMAIAGIGQGLAIAAAFQSLPILVYSLLGAAVWQLVVRPIEEQDMAKRFGDSYAEYRERVTCWLPRFLRARRWLLIMFAAFVVAGIALPMFQEVRESSPDHRRHGGGSVNDRNPVDLLED